MTAGEIKTAVLRLLGQIAPEADLSRIKPNVEFRDQLDLDSMDILNFAISLHKEFNVDVPERDYPKLATLDRCVAYLVDKMPAAK